MNQRLAGFCVIASMFLACPLHGQISAVLEGRVEDSGGAVIPRAQVVLVSSATKMQQITTTSSAGEFSFSDVSPGVYRLDVIANGFRRLSRTGLTATVGQTVHVDLVLSVGEDRQTVSVNADAPLLQTSESDIETHIPGSTVGALPLNSRNFINLTALAPGISLPPGTVLPRIHGGRPRTNEYLYDGISALQPEPGQVAYFPILEDVQEFTVEADNVPAEFGRFNGGVVNVATRAGTNTLHTSLFEFFRNEALNARNYFSQQGRKPEYRRSLYGATLGGPILRDRAFLFGDYQGTNARIGRTVISTVPTLAERKGIFTGVAHIYDPATTRTSSGKLIRREFNNDVIDTVLDPVAKALLTRFPLPTTSGAVANNYTRTANDIDHQNQFDLRADTALRMRDRAFVRYSYFHDVEQPVTPFLDGSGAVSGSVIGTGGVVGLSHVLGQQAVFSETHTFMEHFLNDIHLGYTRRGNTLSGPLLADTASAAVGIPGLPANAAFNNALPLFSFTGFQQLGPSASTFSQYQTGVWQVEEMLNFVRGRHAIKAGADIRTYQLNAISPPNPTGSFGFSNTGTDTQSATSNGTTGGNAIASFLLGQVDTFSIDLQISRLRPRDHIQEYFVQDDWRALNHLTLNLGARWTLHSPSTEKSDQGAVFNLQSQQLQFAGRNGNPRSARELHYGDVAPRIGLTYLLNRKTVLRSGFGIVFIDQSGITTPFTLPQFPFIQNVQQKTQDGVNAAFTLAQGPSVAPIALTPNAGLGQSVYTTVRKAGSGYTEQWNLAFQRQLTSSLSLDIAYVGTHLVHIGIPDANLNQLTAADLAQGLINPASLTRQVANPYFGQIPGSSSIGGKTVAAAQLLKPFPRFQNVAVYRSNSGTANYNALETKIEQRLSRGLYFLFAYTHSKLIDDASSVFSSTVLSSPNSSSLIAADTYRPYLERDSSNGDTPNVTSIAATYDVPMRQSWVTRGRLVGLLAEGWALDAVASLQSGMPVTVTQAINNNAFAGFALQRPNLVAKPSLPASLRTPAKFFSIEAFSVAPQFTLGNASRNPVRGPAYRDMDLALVKISKVGEKITIEFRGEVFNVTNTPAFAQPNGSFGTPAFGSITSTTTEQRVTQFAMRLSR